MSGPTIRAFDRPGGGVAEQIAEFVSAVRAQLNDLSADEVTELTGGLEADLTDALAEAGSVPSELSGDPAEYARELRAAAGLPPRGAGGGQRAVGPGFAERVERTIVVPVRKTIEIGLNTLDAQPWWPGVRDFLVVLRPAWWVLRAWVAVQLLLMLMSSMLLMSFGANEDGVVRGGVGGLLLLLAVIVLSVQLGRRTLLPATWQRITVAAWNLLAVLLLLPVMFSGQSTQDYDQGYHEPPHGLNLGGDPVTNVFPYDAQGRPLTGVQLYDQDGRPLETSGDHTRFGDRGGTIELVPGSPVGSAPRWNAFPLQQRRSDVDTGELGPVEPAPLPLSGVPSVAASPPPEPSVSSSSSPPLAEPTSSASPSKAPKAKPTATK